MSFRQVLIFKCDIHGEEFESKRYSFPPDFRYFELNGETNHICGRCAQKLIEKGEAVVDKINNKKLIILNK